MIRPTAELGENLLPKVNLTVSLLKRWLLGTHQGSVRPQHSGLRSRRVHLPVQEADIKVARPALLSPPPASRGSRTGARKGFDRRDDPRKTVKPQRMVFRGVKCIPRKNYEKIPIQTSYLSISRKLNKD